jgi:hypothetical protein
MTTVAIRSLVLSAALCTVVCASWAVPALAEPRIGVTSATSGGPLGKPPAEAERVLHVGVDVQANEVVTTGTGDRAHLVFIDGSSLTVGPQARLTIDRFVYDPDAKKGALDVTATQGVLRFVGGKISKTAPVTIHTPSSNLTIRGGIMLVTVEPTRTVATFLFGIDMTVTAHGQTQVVTRPGWQVVTIAGGVPGQAVQIPPAMLQTEMRQLEALQAQPGSGDADRAAQTSGFADKNSGQGSQPGGGNAYDPSLGGAATNALSNADAQLQKPASTPQFSPPQQQPPGRRGQ